MGNFDDIGKLKHLPLTDINSEVQFFESEFIATAAAEAVKESNGHNWIPIVVKETDDYQYEVVSNHFVYAVAQLAELDRVWCIVIDPDPKNIEQAKILAREIIPKVNLSTASRNAIEAALKYLKTEPGSALKELDVIKATNRIESSIRETWKDFSPITRLQCGITRGKKLDALAKVFFLSEPILPPPSPEVISVKKATRDEIFDRLSYLSTYKVGGFEEVEPDAAADAIFSAVKGRWRSLNPIAKLECGIDTPKIRTLRTVFSL
jgi:hypothetical protein